jgi:hypothetical protein
MEASLLGVVVARVGARLRHLRRLGDLHLLEHAVAIRLDLRLGRDVRRRRLLLPAAQGEGDWRRGLINVRFCPLCGLKSDISRGPRSANRGHCRRSPNGRYGTFGCINPP